MNRPLLLTGWIAAGMLALLLPAGAQQWVADASKVPIPDHPAAGRIHGAPFTIQHADLDYSDVDPGEKKATFFLNLIHGTDAFSGTKIFITLLTKPGEKIEGKRFTVDPNHVQTPDAIQDGNVRYSAVQGAMVSWAKQDGFHGHDFNSKWSLCLEFGKAKGNLIPGKIYYSLQDAQKSYVAGKFTATLVHIQRAHQKR